MDSKRLSLRAAGIAALGLVGVVLGAAFVARTQIVEAVIHDQLARRGIAGAEFVVVRVGFDGLGIEDIRLGRRLGAASVSVAYTPSGLVAGRIGGIDIDGLEVDVSRPGDGVLGVLGVIARTAAAGDGDRPPPRLPPIRLDDARIRASRPEGDFSIRLDGRVNPDLSAAFEAVIDLATVQFAGHRFSVEGARVGIAVEAGGTGAEVRIAGATLADTAAAPWFPPLAVGGAATFDGAALTFDLAAETAGGGGRLTVEGVHHIGGNRGTAVVALEPMRFEAGGRQPADLSPLAAVPGTVTGTVSARASLSWEDGGFGGAATADLAGVSLAAGGVAVDGLSAALGVAMNQTTGAIEADLRNGRARLEVAGIAFDLAGVEATAVSASGLDGLEFAITRATVSHRATPPWLAPLAVRGNGRLDGTALSFRARATAAGGAVEFDVTGRHDLATGRGAAAVAVGPVGFDRGGLQPADVAPAAAVAGAVSGNVSGQAFVDWGEAGIAAEALADLDGLSLVAAGISIDRLSAALHLAVAPGMAAIDVVGGRARLDIAGTRLEVAGVEATATLDGDRREIGFELAGATVSHLGRPPWMAPIGLSGSGRLDGTALSFRAEAVVASGRARAGIEGGHDLATGRGRATVALVPVRFEHRGLQPGDLAPAAAVAGEVAGTVTGGAFLGWQGGGLDVEAVAELSGFSAAFGGFAVDRLSARLSAVGPDPGGRFAIDIEGAGAAVSHDGRSFLLDDVTASLAVGGGTGIDLTVAGATLRHDDAEPWFAPLSVHGTASLDGGVVRFGGQGGAVTFGGRHDLASGAGEATARLAPLGFSPGGLHPGDLVPALGVLGEVAGTVAGGVDVRWRDGEIDGGARVEFQELSLATETLAVEGLSGIVVLDRLNPPAATATQTLSARRISAAIPLEAPRLDFRFEYGGAADGLRIHLDRAEAGFAGGKLSIVGAVIDPGAESHRAVLRLTAIDLGVLMSLLEVEGVSGEGTMNGTLPVEVRGDSVAVSGGRLESEGGGVLRFRSEPTRQALAAAGEQVALLLDLVGDFHYRRLTMRIDKTADGEAAVGLAIEGNNPAVRDGRTFVLNVDLKGNVDRLLAVVLEGYRLSDRAIRATLGTVR